MMEILTQNTEQINILLASLYTLAALFFGGIIAFVYKITNKNYSKNFLYSLLTLPAIVSIIIMLVNGNFGTGIAVAGAFSLIKFRSAQGSSKDIATIFLTMAIGLATGTGYILFAFLMTILFAVVYVVFTKIFKPSKNKLLKITIPENLEYDDVFNDLLEKYTSTYNLLEVKTTNMGSLFEIKYEINFKHEEWAKEFIDEIRMRNGNLPITISSVISKDIEF